MEKINERRAEYIRKDRLRKKVIKTTLEVVQLLVGMAGFILMIGAAGGVDFGLLSIGEMVAYESVGIAMILLAA